MGKSSNISFAEWGIKKFGKDFLNTYWDYDKNILNPYEIPFCFSKSKVWIKCLETNYHGSYDIKCANFINGQRCGYCHKQRIHPKDSFAQYLIDNFGENALELYWDYEKNTLNPWEIGVTGHLKVYLKCLEKDYHGSYKIQTCCFVSGIRCTYCNHHKIHKLDSFAQWGIDNLSEDFLEKYWDYDKNNTDPWSVSPRSNKMVFIYCQEKEYHGSYEIRINHFTNGIRCGYCVGKKVHEKDSIAQWGIDNIGDNFLDEYWSWDENKMSPWNIYYGTHNKVWLNCMEHTNHGSYKISGENLIKGQGCPKCNESFGEKRIRKLLFNSNIKFVSQYKIDECKNILPLPFDFAVFEDDDKTKLKCLIEYDGEFHYRPARYSKDKDKMLRKLQTQQYHDKIKDDYCHENNIRLVRIPYWEFINIEQILNKELEFN